MAEEIRNNAQNTAAEPQLSEILQVRRDKLKTLQDAGSDPFRITKFDVSHHAEEIREQFEARADTAVTLAGRMMAKRVMGKASFAHIQDLSGKMQLYIARDSLGEEPYAGFKKLDIGDIIGVKGTVFKTKTGEISLHVTELTLLSKSLQPLPEKFHGLTNVDQRYRQRYVDLITNPESKDTFIKRSKIISTIRRFLDAQGFMEVETPMLVSNAGGAAARPFTTHFNALDEDFKLRISLELYLKRLLVGGFPKVFELNRNFRNEGVDRRHNPEFTVLEVYEAGGDYETMASMMEDLICTVAEKVFGTLKFDQYDDNGNLRWTVDLTRPWRRADYNDLVKEVAGADWFDLTPEQRRSRAENELHVQIGDDLNDTDVTQQVYEKLIEEKQANPLFVCHVARDLVPLAKANPEDPSVVDVFELVMNGQELCPGYSEQNDPVEQLERLQHQAGEDTQKIDYDFVETLESGMPSAGGIGIGIDRLCMLMTGASSIRDIILFPQLKNRG